MTAEGTVFCLVCWVLGGFSYHHVRARMLAHGTCMPYLMTGSKSRCALLDSDAELGCGVCPEMGA